MAYYGPSVCVNTAAGQSRLRWPRWRYRAGSGTSRSQCYCRWIGWRHCGCPHYCLWKILFHLFKQKNATGPNSACFSPNVHIYSFLYVFIHIECCYIWAWGAHACLMSRLRLPADLESRVGLSRLSPAFAAAPRAFFSGCSWEAEIRPSDVWLLPGRLPKQTGTRTLADRYSRLQAKQELVWTPKLTNRWCGNGRLENTWRQSEVWLETSHWPFKSIYQSDWMGAIWQLNNHERDSLTFRHKHLLTDYE